MKTSDTTAALDDIGPTSKPFALFEQWMSFAKAQVTIKEATAMALATQSADGDLHARVVLCKEWSAAGGFVFFTNYQSQKGRDLSAHPRAGAVFYWDPLFRQVKLSGDVEKIPRAESEAYWRSRPRESQLSQWLSRQSEETPTGGRDVLERAWSEAEERFRGVEIPCPEHWGGYRLRPKTIEFWIGRPGRLHDRHQFEKSANAWTYRRLYP